MMKVSRKMRSLREYPVALTLLLLGCVGLLYVGLSLAIQAHLPSDGVLLTEFSRKGLSVAISLLPGPHELHVGDAVLSVEGCTIWEWADWAWRGGSGGACARALSSPPDWQVGQTLLYQVRRGGQVVDVPVTLAPFPVGQLPVVRFGAYALVAVSLLVGTYTLIWRPGDAVTRLFFVIALSVMFLILLHSQIMTLVTPWLFVIDDLLAFLSRAVLFSAILHFSLIFPVPKVTSKSLEKRLALLYLVNPVVSVAVGWLLGAALVRGQGDAVSQIRVFVLASQVTSTIGLMMLVGAIASVVHTYLTVHKAAVQGQIRWLFWGSLVGFLPYLLFTGVPEVLTGRAWLNIEVTAFFLIVFPVSLAIAITRYRLFDIDAVLWRILFDVLLAIVTAGVYLLLRVGAGALVKTLTGSTNASTVTFIAVLIAVSAFWILHRPALHHADLLVSRVGVRSRLFLDQAREGSLGAQIIERFASAIRLDQLSALLADEIPEYMGAPYGKLMLLSAEGESLATVDEERFTLPPSFLDVWIKHDSEAVLRSVPQEWVPAEAMQLMEEQAVELLVPLRVGEQIVGLWGLGPREGRLSYTSRDVRAVEMLARHAALAVQNVFLVRRMEQYQHQLEAEVQRRTQAMTGDRDRLNAILQNMADALLVTNAYGQIQLTNPAFENLVRRSSRALVGRYLEQVLPLPKLAEIIGQAMEQPGTIHVANITLVDPRLRSSRDVMLTESILKASVTALGDRSSVICVLQDITHEVEVDQMKSEFISAVSHELRTPLTSILGFAKLTLRTFDRVILPTLSKDEEVQGATQRIARNLDIMVQEGLRLTALINDVLDIAALDAGTITWNDQPYELAALIQRVVERLRSEAEAKGLTLETEMEEQLPLMKADPERIEQVLNNLITNGIKFTERGKVSISARALPGDGMIHDWAIPPEGCVLISVRDTGVGMTPDEMQQIFRRFSQGGHTLLNKPKGTGLGLVISREIVLYYGGEIGVESEPGVGSTFYVMLPLTKPSQKPIARAGVTSERAQDTASVAPQSVAPPKITAQAQERSDANPLILVADGEPAGRDLLRQELHRGGYRVVTLTSGSDVIEQVGQQHPALVVLDVELSGISGMEVLHILKSDPATASVPVIMLSVGDKREECQALGAEACLFKPVDSALLRETIAGLIASRGPAS